MDLDHDACYRALATRDARFDGRFYTGVRSTGVFCRPICPARTPKPEHCVFLPSAAAAIAAGFRPCLRCRPEIAPGVAGWRGTANTVSRALRLIAEGALDEGGVEDLAARLGVGGRYLRRLFERHLGASPSAVARSHRVLFARTLIGETMLPMTEVALAAGFGSIRQFNAAIRRSCGRSPTELRRRRAGADAGTAAVTLRLPYVSPYDWDAMVGFLGPRALPGVELVEAGRYRRNFALDGGAGRVEVRPSAHGDWLEATVTARPVTVLASVIGRLRALFDLDADIAAIASDLGRDPRLAPLVAARPGLRVPGAWDGFELAVRAILGQQVSVVAATTLAGRLVAAFGEPSGDADLPVLFPRAEILASADLAGIGLPRARAAAISALAAAVAADPDLLRPVGSLEATTARLTRLPGIGGWTAQYVAMRALREPDAFPHPDIGLLRAMATGQGRPSPAELATAAEAWRPWRAYAALHLWTKDAAPWP